MGEAARGARQRRAAWDACLAGDGVNGWQSKLPTWAVGDKVATRKASGACLNALVDVVPGLMAGGADLTGNTGTELKDDGVQSASRTRRPPDPLRHPRARHGRGDERHGRCTAA